MGFVEKERYQRTVKITGGLWDAYKFYKNKYPKSVIDRKTYVKICHLFNQMVSDRIIRNSTEYRMPNKLGFIRIKSFRPPLRVKDGDVAPTRKSVDWEKTLGLWEKLYGTKERAKVRTIKNKPLVYHVNEHTNGYSMKWHWDKRGCNIKNNKVYSFSPVKGGITKDGYHYGRKGLAAWIVNDDRVNEYYL